VLGAGKKTKDKRLLRFARHDAAINQALILTRIENKTNERETRNEERGMRNKQQAKYKSV
jgi:hypothetical protein